MKIGILSDSHDNLPRILKAVRFFNRQKVGLVLHAGDFVAPFTVQKLGVLTMPWHGVFGNNDGEKNGLSKISAGRIQPGPIRLRLDAKRITLVHDLSSINPHIEKADFIICGHTHKPEIRKLGAKLIINPGESGGWLSNKATVAILDLNKASAKIVKI
jgi:putative phosphoesterase